MLQVLVLSVVGFHLSPPKKPSIGHTWPPRGQEEVWDLSDDGRDRVHLGTFGMRA